MRLRNFAHKKIGKRQKTRQIYKTEGIQIYENERWTIREAKSKEGKESKIVLLLQETKSEEKGYIVEFQKNNQQSQQ